VERSKRHLEEPVRVVVGAAEARDGVEVVLGNSSGGEDVPPDDQVPPDVEVIDLDSQEADND
jgi:hypothetical protein